MIAYGFYGTMTSEQINLLYHKMVLMETLNAMVGYVECQYTIPMSCR